MVGAAPGAPSRAAVRGRRRRWFPGARRALALAAACPGALFAVADSAYAQGTSPHTVSCAGHRVGTRSSHTLAYDGRSRRVVMFGGLSGDEANRQPRSLWAWDGARWTCLSADGPPRRTDAFLAYDEARGRLVLFGGRVFTSARDFRFLRDTWEWDGARWTLVDTLGPGPRIHGPVAYDPVRRAVVIHGGGGEHAMMADTWEWTGSSWRRVELRMPAGAVGNTLQGTLGGLLLLAAVRDSSAGCAQAGGRAVVLREQGGAFVPSGALGPCLSAISPASPLTDGMLLYTSWNPREEAAIWIWRDGVWRRTADMPPRRRGPFAALDRSRGRVVLFGGNDESGFLGDTWEWDGTRWARVGG